MNYDKERIACLAEMLHENERGLTRELFRAITVASAGLNKAMALSPFSHFDQRSDLLKIVQDQLNQIVKIQTNTDDRVVPLRPTPTDV